MPPSETFCILPWIHLSTRSNGDMQLCCHANSSSLGLPGCVRKDDKSIVNLKTDSFKNHWNGSFIKNVRKKMLNNEIPESCRVCFVEEAKGYRSKRLWENDEWLSKIDLTEITKSPKIKYLDIKLGNMCNLACVMCNPNDSNQLIKDFEKLRDTDIPLPQLQDNLDWYKSDLFWKDFENILPDIKSIYVIGGEPTINPYFKKLLQYCIDAERAPHITLRFNTNGHNLTEELIDLYKQFKSIKMHLSMDGIEKYHEFIRYPSTWSKMQEILDKHEQLSRDWSTIEIDIDCTVSLLNVEHIPDFIKWKVQNLKYINKKSFRGLIGLHFLYYPDFLSTQVLPETSKKRIASKYRELKEWLKENVSEKASSYPKLDAIINHMQSEDKSNLLPVTRKYLSKLLELRSTPQF